MQWLALLVWSFIQYVLIKYQLGNLNYPRQNLKILYNVIVFVRFREIQGIVCPVLFYSIELLSAVFLFVFIVCASSYFRTKTARSLCSCPSFRQTRVWNTEIRPLACPRFEQSREEKYDVAIVGSDGRLVRFMQVDNCPHLQNDLAYPERERKCLLGVLQLAG